MKLATLLNKITPLPWTLDQPHAKSVEQYDANRRYENHAANSLPKLAEALKATNEKLESLSCSAYPNGLPERVEIILQQGRVALAEAREIKP